MARIIDGTKLAQELEVKLKITGIVPCLGIIVFDNDRAGQVYSRLKTEAAARVGIKVITSSDPAVLAVWNNDSSIHGILIQHPGYRGPEFEKYWQKLVNKINPAKDVDGLRAGSRFVPATVKAVELILENTKLARGRAGLSYIVVGRGMVGKALAKRLNAKNISSLDDNLITACLKADILISASGRQGLIKAVKPGAIVIDLGWPKGDVDFAAVKNIAGAITPVPGGVGPVTVVSLLENLLQAV